VPLCTGIDLAQGSLVKAAGDGTVIEVVNGTGDQASYEAHALGWGFEKPNQKALFEPGRGWGLQKCPFGGVAGVKRGKGGGEKGGGRKGEKKGRGEKGGKVDVFVFPGHFFGSPRVTLGTKTAPQNSTSASLPSLLLCTILQGGPKIFLGGQSPL
jgi:hypothetical protein